MALKFKCRQCSEYIITKFLKVGEVAKCQNCGAENRVPENAPQAEQEPRDVIPTGTTPEMAEKTNGRIRPFGSVLILSIITLSIYFWVYLFKTLREMKKAFTFEADETNPDRVRHLLIAYLIVFIVVGIVIGIVNGAVGWPFGTFVQPSKTTGFYVWLVISNIIETVVFVVFFSSFLKLIELCQKQGGMAPLNKSAFWTLIGVSIGLSFAYIATTSLTSFMLISLVDVITCLVLLYLMVKQINRLWIESHNVRMS